MKHRGKRIDTGDMKLELNHLVGYLPYGLEARMLNDKIDYVNKEFDIIEGLYLLGGLWHCQTRGGSRPSIDRIKPLLRPLSDLTKDMMKEIAIIEASAITGSTKVMKNIVSLNRRISFDSSKKVVVYEYENVVVEISHYRGAVFHKKVLSGNDSWVFSYFHNYQKIIEKLYEWHFDIHGLIEQGLAIDKTLER